MKYFLAMMMVLAISFSSATFAAEPKLTQADCVYMGEIAYNVATARDQGITADAVLKAILGSNGEATPEETSAFSEFVNGIYSDELAPDSLGIAVIQSCLGEIAEG